MACPAYTAGVWEVDPNLALPTLGLGVAIPTASAVLLANNGDSSLGTAAAAAAPLPTSGSFFPPSSPSALSSLAAPSTSAFPSPLPIPPLLSIIVYVQMLTIFIHSRHRCRVIRFLCHCKRQQQCLLFAQQPAKLCSGHCFKLVRVSLICCRFCKWHQWSCCANESCWSRRRWSCWSGWCDFRLSRLCLTDLSSNL